MRGKHIIIVPVVGQRPANTKLLQSTPMLLDLLKELGVDTDREFIINGTKCEVRDGRIREAGYTHFAPGSVYNAMVKRYEEWLYKPLAERG